ncbi:hypothetical protein [Phenylobacterium sp.]|jgi:hypothetical protein|uniref:hypothetical protein n=1 Tax=Phenylobacterium sp. TaxID=1871053 RepID=UPI002F93CF53
MSRISTAFFGAAVLYALVGMGLGMMMGASNDHTLSPVHAHINLLGWASLAIMGAFYGIAGARTPGKLAWANFVVSNVGNLMSLPMVAMVVQGKQPILPMLIGGEVLIVLGMVLFGAAVVMVGARSPAAAA